jgi:hypothetical protein
VLLHQEHFGDDEMGKRKVRQSPSLPQCQLLPISLPLSFPAYRITACLRLMPVAYGRSGGAMLSSPELIAAQAWYFLPWHFSFFCR